MRECPLEPDGFSLTVDTLRYVRIIAKAANVGQGLVTRDGRSDFPYLFPP